MNIKFGVFWKQNLGTIYKDNSITTLGKEADVDLNLSEVSSIHANFKVDGKNYTSIVYIVDIEKGLIRIPFTREVLSIGMHELELVAVMKNGDVIPSQTFTYNIVESLDNLEDITEETNYPILIQLLQDVNSKIAEIDDAIARIPSPEELKGEKGDKGEKGEQGIQGERGLQGIQGIRGEKGDKGDRGLQGIQGVKGEKGDKGERGERGLQGIQGNQGARGIQGEKGDKGETGVGLGFEWSGTRLGIKKDTDISYKYVELKGVKGEQGAKGEKGDTPSITHLEKQVADKSKELDTKFNTLTAKQQQDAEVVTARDGEVSLHARLERDLEKGKIHFVDVEGSNISTESEEGYLENVEIHGNTWQNANNLSDIRSVGTKVEGQELYKIDVVSCGKNLFDGKFFIGKGLDGTTGNETTQSDRSVSDYIPVQENTPIRISGCTTRLIRAYDKNKKVISGLINNITPISAKYIRFSIDNTVDFSETQVEYTTQATPYEPYQEDKLTILSPTPLEKVGDVADRIVCKDGVYGVEKNIKTVVLDGSEDWLYEGTGDSSSIVYGAKTTLVDLFVKPDVNKIRHLSFPLTPKEHMYWSSETEGIHFHPTHNNVYVNALISRFKDDSLESFKKWLQANPQTIKFQLVTPTFIPLPHDQQVKLRTFANKTHILFDTEIQPTLKAQVPKSLGATVNTHTTQIDNLNKELDRVKKLEESTVSTVITDKAFTTVAETSNGYFEDVKLEGRTLVNLVIEGKSPTDYKLGAYVFNTPTDDVHDRRCYVQCSHLKPSTIYTVVMNADIRVKPKQGAIIDTYGSYGSQASSLDYWKINTTGKQLIVHKVVTRDTFDEGVNKNWGLFHLSSIASTADVTVSNIMVLEGDHTDKDISYFEGLKSVGQDSDEIEILSMNKNLCTVNSYSGVYQNKIEANIPCKKNTIYTLTFKDKSDLNQSGSRGITLITHKTKTDKKDHGNIYNHSKNEGGKEYTFRESGFAFNTSDCCYISLTSNNSFGVPKIDVREIQIEEGSQTSYSPHTFNKKQILYFNPTTQTWEKPVLREWDSIEKHSDGKYYYHKRSEEITIDGSYCTINGTTGDITEYLVSPVVDNINYKTATDMICDKIQVTPPSSYKSCIFLTTNRIRLRLLTSDYGNESLAKEFLSKNPLTVVYPIKEEVYECTNLDLITYSGVTHLTVNSGAIQPKITLKVLSNVSNVVKLLQEKVSILENKFIKGLQQVLAGDMMSLAHLLYPEDFENNHEIQTLEL